MTKSQVYNLDKLKPYNYAVEYENYYGKFTFEKKRQFLDFLDVTINGQLYQTAKFKDEYYINAIDQAEKQEFYQLTYYAKNIGMVKYERHMPKKDVAILELSEIMSESTFDSLRNEAGL